MGYTKKQVTEMLKGSFSVVSSNTKNKTFVAKKSYYYRTTKLDALVERVKEIFPDANIVNKGDHFRPFYGGAKAGSAKDSYMWVEFNFEPKSEVVPEIISE